MTVPLIIGCLWVLAAAATALMPMKRQMVPGVALLIAAPLLLIWIGFVHGWVWVALGTFAFVSMFRNPLIYFAKCAMGKPVQLPPELRE
ncbi:MAG: DUF2484 family protein [Paracoccaceae bacterium]